MHGAFPYVRFLLSRLKSLSSLCCCQRYWAQGLSSASLAFSLSLIFFFFSYFLSFQRR